MTIDWSKHPLTTSITPMVFEHMEKNLDRQWPDTDFVTAVMAAARSGDLQELFSAINRLLAWNQRGPRGLLPEDEAMEAGHGECAAVLRSLRERREFLLMTREISRNESKRL